MRKFLVAGNWKMHGDEASNRALVAGILEGAPVSDRVSLLVCPPYPYLASVASQLQGSGVQLGAQNVSEHEKGAYTGEVAPAMLLDVGCRYVIVGHSERRTLYGETSEQVAAKMAAALAAGLVPILCVGETLDERESGSTEQVVGEQLAAVVDRNGIAAFGSAVIAYEPVWAIGTGQDGDTRAGPGRASLHSLRAGETRRGRRGKRADTVRRQRERRQCAGTFRHARHRRRADRGRFAESRRFPGDCQGRN